MSTGIDEGYINRLINQKDNRITQLKSQVADLLDALTDLVGGCGKEGDLYSNRAMDKARAAIQKAMGE